MKQNLREKNSATETTDAQQLELLKAVAQAWHAHSGNPKPTDEFRARKSTSAHSTPTRFKLEAMQMAARAAESNWDFAQSLWDSYEIVTLSKRLEANFALDDDAVQQQSSKTVSTAAGSKRARESRSSLRSLLQRVSSSKRFDA